jgi:hypothetical protein
MRKFWRFFLIAKRRLKSTKEIARAMGLEVSSYID